MPQLVLALVAMLLAAPSVCAQSGRASAAVPIAQPHQLTKSQIETVRRVDAYFNQLASLMGSFVQTSADNKRERGKFYISRPGRFRFEFNRPSRVVIISDGTHIAIQDRDLNTDDRWDLAYTPFRALLQKDVDLLRDARVLDARETDDSITISFEDKSGDANSRMQLFLLRKPAIQMKAWIVKDAQGFDTRIDLTEVLAIGEPDPQLFNPAAR